MDVFIAGKRKSYPCPTAKHIYKYLPTTLYQSLYYIRTHRVYISSQVYNIRIINAYCVGRCTPAQCRRRRHRWNDRTEGGKINRHQITIVWRRMTIDDYLPTMMIILLLLLGIIIVFVAWLMPCSVGTFIWMLCFKIKNLSLES